jgi:hypothetical protein
MEIDAYGYADQLKSLAIELGEDTSGSTLMDVRKALYDASEAITILADQLTHYETKNRIAVVVDGQEVALDQKLVDRIHNETVRTLIEEALTMYMNASKVI